VAAAPVWMGVEELGEAAADEPPVAAAEALEAELPEAADEALEAELPDGEAAAEAGVELPPAAPAAPAAHLQTALAADTTAGALWTPQPFTTQVSARLEILTLLADLHWQAKSVSWQPATPPADSRHV